jgi:uncharacterized membrane protein
MQVVYGAFVAQQHISGPLPSPDLLRQYEELSPGTTDRLIRIAEQEAEHRRKVELEIIAIQGRDQSSYRRSELWGQTFGFAIGVIAIVGAVFAAVRGEQVAASFIGTTGVGGLVSAFIIGRSFLLKQKKQDFDQALQANLEHGQASKTKK